MRSLDVGSCTSELIDVPTWCCRYQVFGSSRPFIVVNFSFNQSLPASSVKIAVTDSAIFFSLRNVHLTLVHVLVRFRLGGLPSVSPSTDITQRTAEELEILDCRLANRKKISAELTILLLIPLPLLHIFPVFQHCNGLVSLSIDHQRCQIVLSRSRKCALNIISYYISFALT